MSYKQQHFCLLFWSLEDQVHGKTTVRRGPYFWPLLLCPYMVEGAKEPCGVLLMNSTNCAHWGSAFGGWRFHIQILEGHRLSDRNIVFKDKPLYLE